MYNLTVGGVQSRRSNCSTRAFRLFSLKRSGCSTWMLYSAGFRPYRGFHTSTSVFHPHCGRDLTEKTAGKISRFSACVAGNCTRADVKGDVFHIPHFIFLARRGGVPRTSSPSRQACPTHPTDRPRRSSCVFRRATGGSRRTAPVLSASSYSRSAQWRSLSAR